MLLLKIRREGRYRKFVQHVAHRTFAGQQAIDGKQPVLIITERCVFRLTSIGLELIEIAPGIDLEKDILANMDFNPIIRNLRQMDPMLFSPETMPLPEYFY